MAVEDTLPDVVVASTRRLSEIASALTRRHAELRGLQYRLKEAGLDEEATMADAIADSIELAISAIARERIRLDVSATGSAEQTSPGHPSGEWRPVR